jgi:hypothetical protein
MMYVEHHNAFIPGHTMSDYFAIQPIRYAWGDYGDILVNGLAETKPDAVEVSRAGPFVPPLTRPFAHVIVTDSLRRELESSGLTGIGFAEVRYAKVVRIDWHTWRRDAAEPEFYPETGEPEDYVLEGGHDPALPEQMPRLWKLNVPSTPALQFKNSWTFHADRHPGTDIARDTNLFWVNERMKS